MRTTRPEVRRVATGSAVIATALASLVPASTPAAIPSPDAGRRSIEERAAAVRGSLASAVSSARLLPTSPGADIGTGPIQLAWWGNWHNWGGHPWWHNWPNWHNWHNWGNGPGAFSGCN